LLGRYPETGRLRKASFWVELLPFLEQSNIKDMYVGKESTNENSSWPHWDSQKAAGCPRLKVAECPATPQTTYKTTTGEFGDHTFFKTAGGKSADFGVTDYQGVNSVFGSGTFANGRLIPTFPETGEGILASVSAPKLNITDGLSNTIMLIESAGLPD